MAKKRTIGTCLLVALLSSELVFVGLPGEARAQPKIETSTTEGGTVGIEIPIAPT